MASTDALSRIAAVGVLVIACRSTPMPDPSTDAATSTSNAAVEATQAPRTAWPSTTSTNVLRLRVRALTCHGCAWQIGETLAKNAGIADVSTSVPEKLVTIRYDAAKTNPATIRGALAEVGYESEELP